MRVLLFAHPEADFLEAVVYMGLKDILGDDCVEYPHKLSYHGQMAEYPSPYSHPVWTPDRSGTHPWERPALEAPGAVGRTAPFAWMPDLPGRAWTGDEVLGALRDRAFDLIVVTPRLYNVRDLREFRGQLGEGVLPPVVLMDGEDYQAVRWDLVDDLKPKLYLKRELVERPGDSRVRVEPFPLASPVPPRDPVDKEIDVLFLGGQTWPGREEACRALRGALGDRFVGGVGTVRSYGEYLDAVARARVVVSMRGYGYDTLRYWEVPSFDTLMVTDPSPLIRPHPFVDGQHVLQFGDPGHLIHVVVQALQDESRQRQIALAGNAHLREHHTARARAAQLLSEASK